MTREERDDAINFFKEVAKREVGTYCKLAIEALEQQPCEEAEIKKIDEWEIQGKHIELWIVKGNLQVRYLGTIHNIPLSFVTPKKKTGKWISDKCSNCGNERAWYGNNPKFCPDCSVKMIDQQGQEEVRTKSSHWVSEQDKNEAMASSLGHILDGLAMDLSCE